jgi:hypothetical protein
MTRAPTRPRNTRKQTTTGKTKGPAFAGPDFNLRGAGRAASSSTISAASDHRGADLWQGRLDFLDGFGLGNALNRRDLREADQRRLVGWRSL